MKVLISIVTSIVVLTADGWDFRNIPGEPVPTTGEAQLFPEENTISTKRQEESGPANEDHQVKDSNIFDVGGYQDQEESNVNQKIETKQYNRKVSKPKCKAKTTCVLLGGFCTTNTTVCQGRLVQECKGRGCQCCVPGTVEAKLDKLEDNMNNIYSNISSMFELQFKNQGTMDAKLDKLEDAIVNIYSNISSMFELQCKNKVPTTTTTTPTTTTPVSTTTTTTPTTTTPVPTTTTTTPTTTTPGRCPGAQGYFKQGNQCFKFLNDSASTWSDAKSRCQRLGLVLAKPHSPIELRIVMVNLVNKYAWIGARGTGSSVNWDRDGSTIPSSYTAWLPGHPGRLTSTSHCLLFLTQQSNLNRYPTKAYYMNSCTDRVYPLCELV